MSKRYSVHDAQSGKVITFDWNDPTPPTDADMEEISKEADTAKLGSAVSEAESMGINTHPSSTSLPVANPKHWETPDEPSLGQNIVRTGLRVGVPLGVGAGIAASGGMGALALAATMFGAGALGEGGAEYLESQPGPGKVRKDVNPSQVAMQGALNAIPLGGGAASTLPRALALHGAKGAVLGGVAGAATPLAEGQMPTVGGVGRDAALGGLMGGVVGGGAHWLEQYLGRLRGQPGADIPAPDVPPAFDAGRPSMSEATHTPVGMSPDIDTHAAVPPSIPAGPGVPPPFTAEAVMTRQAQPARTPLGWQLRSTPGGSEGSWSGPVPGGMVQGADGVWRGQQSRAGGTTTSMELPLQDFEATTGTWDRQAQRGNPGLAPEGGPGAAGEAPPPGMDSALPPGPDGPPGPPGGPEPIPEPTFAPGEDNTLQGLRTMLSQAQAKGDTASMVALQQEIRRREGAMRGAVNPTLLRDLGAGAAGATLGAAAPGDDATWQDRVVAALAGGAAGVVGHRAYQGSAGPEVTPHAPQGGPLGRVSFDTPPAPLHPNPEFHPVDAPVAPPEKTPIAPPIDPTSIAMDRWGDQQRALQSQKGAVGTVPLVRTGSALAGGALGAATGPDDQPLEDRILRGAAGAAAGYAGARLMTRGGAPQLHPGSGIPELTAQRTAQAAPQAAASSVGSGLRTAVMDSLTPIGEFLDRMKAKTGVEPTSDVGFKNIFNIRGGQGGLVAIVKDRFDRITKQANDEKLTGWVQEYLNLKGMGHAGDTLREKARAMSDPKQAQALLDSLASGEALPDLDGSKMTPAKVKALEGQFQTRAGAARFTRVQQLSKQVIDMNLEALNAAEAAGLVRPEVAKKLRTRSDDYVPMTRIMDAIAEQSRFQRGSSMQLKEQRVLFNLEGSEKINKDPILASFNRYAEVLYEAGRNEAAQNVNKWRSLGPEWEAQLRDISRGGTAKKGEIALGFFDKGERKTLAVPEPLGVALMTANNTDIDSVFRVLGKFNNLLRNTAITLSPGFAVKNVLKDMGDYRKLSKGVSRYNPADAAKYVGEWVANLKDTLDHGPSWQDMMKNRAGYGTLARQLSDRDLLHLSSEAGPLGKVKEGITHVSNTIEENTKSVAYQRNRKAGMAPVDAAYETRLFGGSPDYARKGTAGAKLGVMQTFFNAQIQGISRTFNRYTQNPKMLGMALAGTTLSALARDEWNRQFTDSDGVLAIDKLPENDRKNYFAVVAPQTYVKDGVTRHYVAKIPKGHVAQLLANPIEGLIAKARGADRSGKQIALDAISNVSPGNMNLDEHHPYLSAAEGVAGALNPALKAVASQAANRDFAFGQPVVPRRLETASPNEQYDERTSPTVVKATQLINHLGTEFSPVRVQQALKDLGLMSGPLELAFGTSDAAIGGMASKRPGVGPEAITRTPILGPLARPFLASSLDQTQRDKEERFYDALNKSQVAVRDRNNAMMSNGQRSMADFQIDPVTGKPANPERMTALATSSAMAKISQTLGTIREAQRQVQQRGLGEQAMTALVKAEQLQIEAALKLVDRAHQQFGSK